MSTEMNFGHIVSTLRADFAHLNFILVTSPTTRCGITLIQRMLNGGGDSIIYGENMYLLYKLTSELMQFGNAFAEKQKIIEETRGRFRTGSQTMDATTLFPDYANYIKQVLQQFYHLMENYQNDAQRLGYQTWGIKCPMPETGNALGLFRLLPRRQAIVVERGLIDVTKSMYSRWPENFPNAEAFRSLGQRWMMQRIFLHRMKFDSVVRIAYDEWMRAPDAVASAIEDTFGVRVARDEVNKKINIHDTDRYATKAQRKEDGFYLPPSELPAGAEQWLMEGVQKAKLLAGATVQNPPAQKITA